MALESCDQCRLVIVINWRILDTVWECRRGPGARECGDDLLSGLEKVLREDFADLPTSLLGGQHFERSTNVQRQGTHANDRHICNGIGKAFRLVLCVLRYHCFRTGEITTGYCSISSVFILS